MIDRFRGTAKPVVLVVDDAPANIHMLVEALRDEYDIKVAVRGNQALELAERDPQPDIILLDIQMPDMDGLEVCRRLKSQDATRHIPVIFVTAETSWAVEHTCFEVGGVDFVTKPFSIPVVRARVRTHVTLKHRTDMLERLAQLDGLTGIANRRRFDEALLTEWMRCAQHQMPLSLILADVDHFKQFNDTYGHGAGDHCLRGIAGILEANAGRPGDLAARYGGEEFVMLLPMTHQEGARQVAERVREQVSRWHIEAGHDSTRKKVTISAGCATAHPKSDVDPIILIKSADDLLYHAKNNGRNQVAGAEIS